MRNIICLIIVCVFSISCLSQKPKLVTKIPFKLIDDIVYIKLKVNEIEEQNFRFDTGASRGLITQSLCNKLNLKNPRKVKSKGFGGERDLDMFVGNKISLGGIEIDNVGLMNHGGDMDNINQDGVIGYDILSKYVVKINYDSNYLELYSYDGFAFSGKGSEVKFLFRNNTLPYTSFITKIGSQTYNTNYIIDTGARGYVMLTTKFATRNNIESNIKKSLKIHSATPGMDKKAVDLTVFRINELTFDKHVFNGIPSNYGNITTGGGAMTFEDVDGIIGNSFLKRFNITYNYNTGRMYLEQNKYYNEEIRVDCFGAMWKLDNNRLMIAKVLDDSIAEEYGLKINDELLQIDEILAKNITPKLLDDILTSDNRTIKFKYKRGGKINEVIITLKALY